ncbi:E3 ubiquitin-protein ligase MIB2-like isoform X2 [Oopsacas minuta]|uniref:RING-type E3 ubiquitin transferase n=1 Tax=Oopsacas minuta TaxID=111878 RepID=A0AAV7KQU0_9METZ|nr:E3 ubiquitin-protein ligase MIB2-like isoform X2 [Oopsacas minuta]
MTELHGWQVNERVSILLDVDTVQQLQESYGGWRPEMARCMGRIGKITSVGYHTVDVEYEPGECWAFNPIILTRVMPFQVGDRVKVLDDERRTKELQRDHGGWVDAMSNTIGQDGEVKRVFADGDLRVEVAGSSWTFNPNALIPIGPPNSREGPVPAPAPVQYGPESLSTAVANGDLDRVKAISQASPQLLRECVNGMNALHIACNAGNDEIVSYLLGQGVDPNQPDLQGKTPLMYCCEVFPNPMCVRHLIEAGAKPNDPGKLNNKYPLLLAIERNLNEITTELIQSQKCNVKIRDSYTQETALHIAARVSNLNTVMNLLDAGADPELCDGTGLLPLHVGILQNSSKVVGYLLQKRPNLVNIKAKRGQYDGLTPLHLAILRDHFDCLILILGCPIVNLEQRDSNKLTPFLFAVYEKKFHMLDVLFQKGCDAYTSDSFGNNALHILFNSNCDNYDLSLLRHATTLQAVFKEVEQQYGSHIRIALCCYLIQKRVPYLKKNISGVSALSELSPDVRRYCEDKAPPQLPDCTLCNLMAEFMNTPCGHVTYCIVHSIDGSRCYTCNGEVTNFNPLAPFALERRLRVQGNHNLIDQTHIPVNPRISYPPAIDDIPVPLPPNLTHSLPPAPPPHISPTESLQPKEEDECDICCESYKERFRVAFDPCGHVSCKVCAEQLKECHKCRRPIIKWIRIFS